MLPNGQSSDDWREFNRLSDDHVRDSKLLT